MCLTLAVLVIAGISALSLWIISLGPAPLGEHLSFSTLVVDRDGKLLRPYTTPDGRWRLPATRDSVDPRFLDRLFAYEDKRFPSHHGIDPRALGRAFSQLLVNGRIVSGASTLTMQVARLLEPRSERSFTAKLKQMVRAIELERALSKDEILSLYLSLAPYGGNLEGVRAASLAYFGKEPRRLTLGEAALLVALPQSPEQRRPDRSMDASRKARDRVLDRLALAGAIPADEIARAKQEPIPDGRKAMPMLAPHASDAVVGAAPDRSYHRLTIDATLQRNLEELARERARALGPDISVAILAVDNATGEVLARVASADYLDERRAGAVDMTQAVRSPGSTLKPFIYGLGFEDGLIHPDTLIEDRPIRYGSYAPENFDLTFQGTVTVRRALQLSLNVPAVAVLDKVGASRFAARLEQAGGAITLPPGEAPGLAMGLGGVGVKLSDLVALYAGLARQGTTVPLVERFATPFEAPPVSFEARRCNTDGVLPPPLRGRVGEGGGAGDARSCQIAGPPPLTPPQPAAGLPASGNSNSDQTPASRGLVGEGKRPQQVAPLCQEISGACTSSAEEAPTPRRLLDPAAAWYVGNILLGTPPPENAAGGRIAFKTGTSYGYRDAWSVGFDGKRTIGVWVGRADGAPVPGLVGRVAAAPILFDAFARTGKLPSALPSAPKGAVVAATGKLPPPLQRFRPGVLAGQSAEPQLRIMFPPNGARLELASDGSGKPDPIALKVTGGAGALTVLVNGAPLPDAPGPRTLFFEPDGPGFVRLTVMDAKGATDSVVVRLQGSQRADGLVGAGFKPAPTEGIDAGPDECRISFCQSRPYGEQP